MPMDIMAPEAQPPVLSAVAGAEGTMGGWLSPMRTGRVTLSVAPVHCADPGGDIAAAPATASPRETVRHSCCRCYLSHVPVSEEGQSRNAVCKGLVPKVGEL